MGRTQLQMLGTVRVERDGAQVQGFESRKAVALLCYLALRGQPQTRAHLAELFWEGKPEERGRGNLNRVLHNLTKVLPGCLEPTRQTVGLSNHGELWSDVATFEALSTRGDPESLAKAAELYQGDLMTDLHLDDCPDFEQWLDSTREHWRQQQITLLHRLIAYHQQRGTPADGIPWTRRLLQIDPWREESHRTLMRLLDLSGQRQAALAQFEACRRVLEDELGVEPEEETVALYERIRDDGRQSQIRPPLPPRPPSRLINLPTPTTSFVDRHTELELLLVRLRDPDCRLVTLTGQGGIGKSRLALEAAVRMAAVQGIDAPFPHGVVFVSLAAVDSAGWHGASSTAGAVYAMSTNIADALRIVFAGPDEPAVQVRNYLREKDLLLVLDNCEQLIGAVGFLADLLRQSPRLKILATSQVRLHLQGEHIVALKGLPIPPSPDAARGEEYSALTLFVARAQAVDPHFQLTPANHAAAVRIAQLVDGMPLGLELAASWVRVLPCDEIARELEKNLGSLKSRHPDTPRRHHSLHAVFDYAWSSLSEDEQRVMRRLSVFRGGFTREAGDRVAAASLPLLALLLDNSLVRRSTLDGASGAMRYDLLEVVRLYAAEKLAEAARTDPVEPTTVCDLHRDYYLDLLRDRTADLRGGRQQETLAEIAREIENIRQAVRWAISRNDIAGIDRALEGLFLFYNMRSWFAEGAAIFAQLSGWLAALQHEHPEARLVLGRALAGQGWFTFQVRTRAEAQTLLEQSLAILRPLEQPAALPFPLYLLAAVLFYQGDYDRALQACQEAQAISTAVGDRYRIAIGKSIQTQIAALQGRYRDARRHGQESLAIDREIGNRWGMAFSLIYLGEVAYAMGDYNEARRSFLESMAIRETMGDIRGVAQCLDRLGDVALAQTAYAEAEASYQAALARFREIGNSWGIAAALTRLGHSALALGDRKQARERFTEALRGAGQTQAEPRILDALLGMANLLREENPAQAAHLAALVAWHPSTTRESCDRAAALLALLAEDDTPAPHINAQTSLDTVVQSLLGGAWPPDG
ncbi:MAG TPA: tetratricopeptide repeat protein [Roseiflexaceae bacterium]|nr:tetratricopeptide repeat protein [Roseiflexaceae bacterium]